VTAERLLPPSTAIMGLVPLLGLVAMVISGNHRYPENNLDGHVYVDFLLEGHRGQLQVLIALTALIPTLLVILRLASAYTDAGAQHSPRAMTVFATLATAVHLVIAGLFTGLTIFVRGYANFGHNSSDFMFITLMWDVLNVMSAIAAAPLAVVWAAIAIANRKYPLLPRLLGEWSAIAVSAINATSTVYPLFIYTGPWTGGSIGHYGIQAVSTYLWVAATAVTFLWSRHRRQQRRASPTSSSSHQKR
jgi:hypothetical protein